MSRKAPSAAAVTARIMWLPALVRILALVCATVSVVGVVAFFAFEGLYPYRWHMLIGGALGSGLFGWIGDRISPDREAVAALRSRLAPDDDSSDADRRE